MTPTVTDTAASLVFVDSLFHLPLTTSAPPYVYLGDTKRIYSQFNPDSAFLTLKLGATENWKIENRDTVARPFHIHTNPFQVIGIEYMKRDPNAPLYDMLVAAAARGAPIWMDVLPLPMADPSTTPYTPKYIVIRQRYEDFIGPTVMHCHILGHEERGMMQRLLIK